MIILIVEKNILLEGHNSQSMNGNYWNWQRKILKRLTLIWNKTYLYSSSKVSLYIYWKVKLKKALVWTLTNNWRIFAHMLSFYIYVFICIPVNWPVGVEFYSSHRAYIDNEANLVLITITDWYLFICIWKIWITITIIWSHLIINKAPAILPVVVVVYSLHSFPLYRAP